MANSIGSTPARIGRYEILHPIHGGGMASVFKAHDPHIDRDVCIKQVRDELDSPQHRELFLREVRAAGKLRHPNIVDIYDTGEFEGRPFIVMEFVPGKTLASLIGNRAPLSLGDRLRLMEQLCDGLACAHRAGIVHRDIKPANLIVDETGAIKILDFGIARLSETGPVSRVIGTINYMSPEQWAGGALDRRSDIFSAGAVCYELLTHQQAFPGDTAPEVYTRIAAGTPRPIDALCPDLDARIVKTVGQMLETRVELRPQWLEPVRDEFQRIRTETSPASGTLFAPTLRLDTPRPAAQPTPQSAPRAQRTRPWLWGAVGAALLAVATYAAITYRERPGAIPAVPAATPAIEPPAAQIAPVAPAASAAPAAQPQPAPAPKRDVPPPPVERAAAPAPPAAEPPSTDALLVTMPPRPPAAESQPDVEPKPAFASAPEVAFGGPAPGVGPGRGFARPPNGPGRTSLRPGGHGRGLTPLRGEAVPMERRPIVRIRCAELLERMRLGETLTAEENEFRLERCRE
jgi:hypothetical protein